MCSARCSCDVGQAEDDAMAVRQPTHDAPQAGVGLGLERQVVGRAAQAGVRRGGRRSFAARRPRLGHHQRQRVAVGQRDDRMARRPRQSFRGRRWRRRRLVGGVPVDRRAFDADAQRQALRQQAGALDVGRRADLRHQRVGVVHHQRPQHLVPAGALLRVHAQHEGDAHGQREHEEQPDQPRAQRREADAPARRRGGRRRRWRWRRAHRTPPAVACGGTRAPARPSALMRARPRTRSPRCAAS